ncbi:MAG: hypothetical protein N3E49_00750 [Bacteroidia bacterium]|nr:hypothetical protein [Bacteroidia bacterium]
MWDFVNQPYRRSRNVQNEIYYNPQRDAMPVWERWAYRFYFTIRYYVN